MRLMLCTGPGVGELPSVDLPADSVGDWQRDRVRVLGEALAGARSQGAETCVVAGGLFGHGFVPQSLLEGVMELLGRQGLPVCYVPQVGEADDLEARIPSLPPTLRVVRCDEYGRASFEVEDSGEHVGVQVDDRLAGLDAGTSVTIPEGGLAIVRGGDACAVRDAAGRELSLGPLEPSSFAESSPSGYVLADVGADGIESSTWVGVAFHTFASRAVALDGTEVSKGALRTVAEAVRDVDRSACLRIVLRGRLPLDVYLNPSDIAEKLAPHFFYVEVADQCGLDIDVEELGSDVSLLAEFVRRVVGDESLSQTERTRILRCGWNALNGRDLAE